MNNVLQEIWTIIKFVGRKRGRGQGKWGRKWCDQFLEPGRLMKLSRNWVLFLSGPSLDLFTYGLKNERSMEKPNWPEKSSKIATWGRFLNKPYPPSTHLLHIVSRKTCSEVLLLMTNKKTVGLQLTGPRRRHTSYCQTYEKMHNWYTQHKRFCSSLLGFS